MARKKLDSRILKKLKEKLPKLNPQSIINAISKIKSDYGVTSNAAGKEYARRNNIKVDRWIDDEDQKSWQEIAKSNIPTKVLVKKIKKIKSKKLTIFIQYETKNRFILGHIKEVNICCTYGAYTSAFILCRKIIENLFIEIIIKKYPQKKHNIPMYFDVNRNRTKDFSEILKNLRSKKSDFGPQKQLLESLLNKTKVFKDEANSKTHSTYHLIRNLKDLDVENIQDILDMILELEKNIK